MYRVLAAIGLLVAMPLVAWPNTLSELDQFGCTALQALRLDALGVEECVASSSIAGGWERVFKPQREFVISTTTLQDDDDLHFAVDANSTYAVRGFIMFYSETTAELKYTFLCPASGKSSWDSRWMHGDEPLHSPVSDTVGEFVEVDQQLGGSTCAVEGAASRSLTWSSARQEGTIQIDGVFNTSGSGGTFQFQWAQNTSDATNTFILDGSYLEYRKVD